MGLNTELRGKQLANLRSDAIVKPWFLWRGKQRKGKLWMNWLVIIFSCSLPVEMRGHSRYTCPRK